MRPAMDFDLNVVEQGGGDEEPELAEEDEEEDEEEGRAEVESQEGRVGGVGASGSRRGRAWSAEEDSMLARLVAAFGPVNWNAMSAMIPGRTGKSCRFRWFNHLDPSVKHEPFSGNRISLSAFPLRYSFFICFVSAKGRVYHKDDSEKWVFLFFSFFLWH